MGENQAGGAVDDGVSVGEGVEDVLKDGVGPAQDVLGELLGLADGLEDYSLH